MKISILGFTKTATVSWCASQYGWFSEVHFYIGLQRILYLIMMLYETLLSTLLQWGSPHVSRDNDFHPDPEITSELRRSTVLGWNNVNPQSNGSSENRTRITLELSFCENQSLVLDPDPVLGNFIQINRYKQILRYYKKKLISQVNRKQDEDYIKDTPVLEKGEKD